jgi:TATA-binding protein-associated factor Taf7
MSFVIQEDSSLPTLHESAIRPASQQSIDEMNASSIIPTDQRKDEKDEDRQEEVKEEEAEEDEAEEKSRLQRFLQSIFAFMSQTILSLAILQHSIFRRRLSPTRHHRYLDRCHHYLFSLGYGNKDGRVLQSLSEILF